jgi:hypothetical protein
MMPPLEPEELDPVAAPEDEDDEPEESTEASPLSVDPPLDPDVEPELDPEDPDPDASEPASDEAIGGVLRHAKPMSGMQATPAYATSLRPLKRDRAKLSSDKLKCTSGRRPRPAQAAHLSAESNPGERSRDLPETAASGHCAGPSLMILFLSPSKRRVMPHTCGRQKLRVRACSRWGRPGIVTFSHGIGDLLTASIQNYLKVELLCENEYANGVPLFRGSPHSRRGALPRDGRQATPDGRQSRPW